MLDLVVIQNRVLRDDLFQESSKGGNVPLTIAQRIEELALGLLTVHAER